MDRRSVVGRRIKCYCHHRWLLAPTQLQLHGDHQKLPLLYLRQAITINELLVSSPLDPADRLAAAVDGFWGQVGYGTLLCSGQVVVLCGKSDGS